MINFVTKSNGDRVPFDANKLNKWAEFASKVVEIDWSGIVLEAYRKCYDGCTTLELHKAMIDACVEKETEDHLKMAGRLLLGTIFKEAFGGFKKAPSLIDYYNHMVETGYWAKMDYTDDEIHQIGLHLDNNFDINYNYTTLRQMKDKYLIQIRTTGRCIETPQYMFLGQAMQAMEKQPKERRLEDVINLFTYIRELKINLPTPMLSNLRTSQKGYASCCVYTVADNIPSLQAGDHIGYGMTCASAGIGAHYLTRSKGDPVKGGTIVHQGKLPYLRHIQSGVHANTKNGRGGAATVYLDVLDPEIFDLLVLKNPTTVQQKRIRDIDYGINVNRYFSEKAAKNEDWMLVSLIDAPELYEAFFSSDYNNFVKIYNKVLNSDVPKTIVKARDILVTMLKEGAETGRIYIHYIDTVNYHTPFKEPIYSSNLCVAPETKILTDKGEFEIFTLKDQEVNVWNGREWSKTTVRQTGQDQKLVKIKLFSIEPIEVSTDIGEDGELKVLDVNEGESTRFEIECTPYHKFFIKDSKGEVVKVEAQDLRPLDRLAGFKLPNDDRVNSLLVGEIIDEGRNDDTYCFTEEKRGMGVFNGILTGNCAEINLVTKPFKDVLDLYSDNPEGEIGLCSLASIVAGRVTEEEYEDVAYYTLLVVDNTIDIMEFPFKSLEVTAKYRRSTGIGITNLAHAMASNHLSYASEAGKNFIHRTAERHSYWLHKASLRLAKEKGICEGMEVSKYKDGWLPIDTYNRNVDEVHTQELIYDWETLREEIIANGGIRNSVLEAMMPVETSSQLTNTTNSLYPIRNLKVMKTSATNKNLLLAPDMEALAPYYDIAWTLDSKHLIEMYAIVQKFTGQGISADLYLNMSDEQTISTTKLMKDYFYMLKLGCKGRYYLNSASGIVLESLGSGSEAEVIEDGGCAGGACTL